MTVLSRKIKKARKTHPCGAYHWFSQSCYGERDFEPLDWLTILVAMQEKGCILPGTSYLSQVSVDGDGFCDFKARLDMHDICLKYDLYPED